MREGSYTQIKHGMRVVGADGQTLGAVDEVLVDEGSGIFVGVTVKESRNTQARLVRGEYVERLHDDVVHLNVGDGELQPYETPAERHHQAEQAYEELNR